MFCVFLQTKTAATAVRCSHGRSDCPCYCRVTDHERIMRSDTEPSPGGQAAPGAAATTPSQSLPLNRRLTVSSPATTVLPTCGICRPLHYSQQTATPSWDLDVESSATASGEEPQSLAVEVDSEQFVDVGVGTDRPPEPSSSQTSDWLSSRLIDESQPITINEPQPTSDYEPQWTEVHRLRFQLNPDNSQPAELVVHCFISA